MARLFAGTSGFAYPSWKPRFYPQELPQKKFLEHYATRLNAVEINYTFRRMPAAATLATWAGATPAGFRFALKANQRITHFQKLRDAAEPTRYFLGVLEPLRASDRLGPVLFQLPPQLRCDPALLRRPAGHAEQHARDAAGVQPLPRRRDHTQDRRIHPADVFGG